MQERNFTLLRGEIWDRLVIIKDRRTHRLRVPIEAAASILIDDVAYVIPVTVNYEGGVRLYMSPEQTNWLEDGEYRWDMVTLVTRSAYYTTASTGEIVPVTGTITVGSYDNITPRSTDGTAEALDAVIEVYVLPFATTGDSYEFTMTFPNSSYLVGAPGNVTANIKADPESNTVDATFTPTVSGAVLTLTLDPVDLDPGTYYVDVQVGSTTYLPSTKLVVEADV